MSKLIAIVIILSFIGNLFIISPLAQETDYIFESSIEEGSVYKTEYLKINIINDNPFETVNITIFNNTALVFNKIYPNVTNEIIEIFNNDFSGTYKVDVDLLETDVLDTHIVEFYNYLAFDVRFTTLTLIKTSEQYFVGDTLSINIASNNRNLEFVNVELVYKGIIITDDTLNIKENPNFEYELSELLNPSTKANIMEVNVYSQNDANINATTSFSLYNSRDDSSFIPVNIIVVIEYEKKDLFRNNEYNITIINYSDNNEFENYECEETLCAYTIKQYSDTELIYAKVNNHIAVEIWNEDNTYYGIETFYFTDFNNTITVTMQKITNYNNIVLPAFMFLFIIIGFSVVYFKTREKSPEQVYRETAIFIK